MRAREWLRQRPGQLEQLEAEVNSGAWTGRLSVFFQSHVALASAMDEWHEIDKRLRTIVSNWSDDQLGVVPLPPIAKLEGVLIEAQTPVAADNIRQALTVGAAPLVEAQINEASHAVTDANLAMKIPGLMIDSPSVINPNREVKAMEIQIKPQKHHPAQEDAILKVLKNLGFNAQSLPKRLPGKPWIKSAVSTALGKKGFWVGVNVFNKAWERLRADGRIAEMK